MNKDDIEALEVSGIAEAQIDELGGTEESAWHLRGCDDLVGDSAKRVGRTAAANAKKRGLEVAAGYRVTRACQLARRRQRVEA